MNILMNKSPQRLYLLTNIRLLRLNDINKIGSCDNKNHKTIQHQSGILKYTCNLQVSKSQKTIKK